MKLHANRPIEKLKTEDDHFGFIAEGQRIANILSSHTLDDIKENNMFVLYGPWGSGKTTLINCIRDHLGEKDNHVVYFEAWKYENDDNLALSLLEAIGDSYTPSSDFMKTAGRYLIAFASSLSLGFGGAQLAVDVKKMEKCLQDTQMRSQYARRKAFETEFKKVENAIVRKKSGDKTPEDTHTKLCIIIDDLDRCEPDTILNLLSAIKHFFSCGERTIFFCALDEEAVISACKHKYGDTVQAEVYLEKIFDIPFRIPRTLQMKKFLNTMLTDLTPALNQNNEVSPVNGEVLSRLVDLFIALDFTSLREIKLLFNRLKAQQETENRKLSVFSYEYGAIYFSVYSLDNAFAISLFFFMTILREYYPDQLFMLCNYNRKISEMKQHENTQRNSATLKQGSEFQGCIDSISYSPKELNEVKIASYHDTIGSMKKGSPNKPLSAEEWVNYIQNLNLRDNKPLAKFLTLFLPCSDRYISYDLPALRFINQFGQNENDEILKQFCRFVITTMVKDTNPKLINQCKPIDDMPIIEFINLFNQ